MGYKILGCGGYLPKRILKNQDLDKSLNTSDEWISSRTGISQRHISEKSEPTSVLAFEAAKIAIENAKIHKSEIDLVIVCTTTADNVFPSLATKLHGHLELDNQPAFDLQAVCSGFIYGMQVADAMLKSLKYKTILLVCAEKMSSLLDWADRKTCVLFGDGAGALLLKSDDTYSGIIDSDIYSDGKCYNLLYTEGGVGSTGEIGYLRMNGSEIYKKAIEKMSESVSKIISRNNLCYDDIDYFIPHQANLRLINALIDRIKIHPSKAITTIQDHANCSAASIPLALYNCTLTNSVNTGDIILFTAFGAGLTWGSIILRW
ncbi:beta-ketoacyl-ACP synthase III [Rickettsia endosymbiont of Cardiosporidium cionae]|uniref:beta-ketoacyl-ACP synthase III n=1 Tax=Rickettsia endosymbiont of Cardiosporidium cionae TaxID=2777155 RepID=UPI0018961583|nr:beta-ketoacyl-ACP synthase III [Rickettsia endosymbiont of Cardiosporidium cionae]KAF8818319.1 ketoacyl-ACP synthase III [Rickettsia endosymbiont of Cardiosporidium cionae]